MRLGNEAGEKGRGERGRGERTGRGERGERDSDSPPVKACEGGVDARINKMPRSILSARRRGGLDTGTMGESEGQADPQSTIAHGIIYQAY